VVFGLEGGGLPGGAGGVKRQIINIFLTGFTRFSGFYFLFFLNLVNLVNHEPIAKVVLILKKGKLLTLAP
jgi:hypothetical protein